MSRKQEKSKKSYIVPLLMVVFLLAALTMIWVLCNLKSDKMDTFTPPPFETEAVDGVPTVSEYLGYTELYQEGMAYRVSICGVVTMKEEQARVYFTNAESNTKYLKLRILDEQDQILGETGLLKPGQYVEWVQLSERLEPGTNIRLKIMGYEPETYESAGSVVLRVTIGA